MPGSEDQPPPLRKVKACWASSTLLKSILRMLRMKSEPTPERSGFPKRMRALAVSSGVGRRVSLGKNSSTRTLSSLPGPVTAFLIWPGPFSLTAPPPLSLPAAVAPPAAALLLGGAAVLSVRSSKSSRKEVSGRPPPLGRLGALAPSDLAVPAAAAPAARGRSSPRGDSGSSYISAPRVFRLWTISVVLGAPAVRNFSNSDRAAW
mmetsp:Transcript_487/g.1042  ORF Transcript_487/g.1042 Transcript_487/m.1042 type:complete len:205 (+) Transcript_487:283-897(+)